MVLLDLFLKKVNLPKHNNTLCLDEDVLGIKIIRNCFPHSILEFNSSDKHTLKAFSDLGVSEALEILVQEFDWVESSDPDDVFNRHHYSSIIIGEKTFFNINEQVFEAFLELREASLIPIPEYEQYARLLVRSFRSDPLLNYDIYEGNT